MSAETDVAYVALGSNLGDREAYLAGAREAIATLPGTRVLAASSIEETPPLAGLPQPAYLNQMLALRTSLDPVTLLAALHAIERRAGRVRGERWAPRTLDLDIVCFERQVVSTPALTVPHPELPHREFWQRELAELRGES